MHDRLKGVGPDGKKFPADKEYPKDIRPDSQQKDKPSNAAPNLCVGCGKTGNKVCNQCNSLIWDKVRHDMSSSVGADSRCLQRDNPSNARSKICVVCGKAGNKESNKCKEIQYCGKKCKSKDWKRHKKVCKEIKATI